MQFDELQYNLLLTANDGQWPWKNEFPLKKHRKKTEIQRSRRRSEEFRSKTGNGLNEQSDEPVG